MVISCVFVSFFLNLDDFSLALIIFCFAPGKDDFFLALEDAAKEYDDVYEPELERRIAEHASEKVYLLCYLFMYSLF